MAAATISFQSTRPSRGATLFQPCGCQRQDISIHAPLAGRDAHCWLTMISSQNFNPRTPRGARRKNAAHNKFFLYFNPRAPRGARQHLTIWTISSPEFQSTCPSRGATVSGSSTSAPNADFNPRAPCGARQQKYTNYFTHFCEKRQGFNYFCEKRRLSKRFSACR